MSLSEALPTTAIDTVSEFTQAIVSEELAKGPYVAASARFEPTTLRTKGIDSTNMPPLLHSLYIETQSNSEQNLSYIVHKAMQLI